jgi:hypothetical protein
MNLLCVRGNTNRIEAMPTRKPKKTAAARRQPDPVPGLRRALSREKKSALVDALLDLAQADGRVLRRLTARFEVAAAPDELVAATHQAIADATYFDRRDINRNFRYDYEAYEAVKRNLTRLIGLGHLRPAMQLALELMKQGSHQVEMSDEGLMTSDIEDCLSVVFKALENCDLPAPEVLAWCSAMRDNDCVGFVAQSPLQSLRDRVQAAAGR